MIFNSLPFLVFLPLVLGVYYVLQKRAQNLWLLLASWFFYAWWDVRFLSLILISTGVDYLVGKGISESSDSRRRKVLLGVSLVTNLSILGFFKYYGFFAESLLGLLEPFHLALPLPALQIILPLGISFYTFQTMAYTIDVYRGRSEAVRKPIVFALYVCYFPQLVAGPIERAASLIPQLEKPRQVDWSGISTGLLLILFGFFKKVAVGDVLGLWVDPVFEDPSAHSGLDLWLAVYGFALQIYCDFSGYTDIARGCSTLLGIRLRVNFEHPYFATSITAFWRRWHISLSAWLRDYLYISLGGNRGGAWRTYRNLMVTMLLGGLWHGASWNFVIWGGLHGLYLAVHRAMGRNTRREKQKTLPGALVTGMGTFHLVCLTWIFFRAPDFASSCTYLVGMFQDLSRLTIPVFDLLRGALPLVGLIVLDLIQFRNKDHLATRGKPLVFQAIFYAYLLMCICVFGALDERTTFIYFQF